MKAFFAFTQKEILEGLRTYKLLILITVFILLGFMNPITAKLTPQLLESFMPAGMSITIPEPTALDSWAQFYKNIPQMGLIVLVIVFSGMMSNEISKGTLINILTKGLSRSTVILSKLTMAISLWTISYFLCFLVSYAYTLYFWPEDRVSHLLFSVLCLWLFGILLISLLLLSGVLFNSSYGSLLFTGGGVVILFILNLFSKIQPYNPILLASKNLSLLNNGMAVSDFRGPIIACVLLTLGNLLLTIAWFNKKEL